MAESTLSHQWCGAEGQIVCNYQNFSLVSWNYCGISKGAVTCSVWLRTRYDGLDSRQGQRIVPLTSASWPALGPTQPPVHRITEVRSPGVKHGIGVTLTTHPFLVLRSKTSRSYASSPPRLHPWRVVGPLYLSSDLLSWTYFFEVFESVMLQSAFCFTVSFSICTGWGMVANS
jgi:hypothetical protein